MTTDTNWRLRAECRNLGPELFYPEQGDHHTAKRAIMICEACPVKKACLEDALSDEADVDKYGIRGGLTPKARRRIRKGEPARRVYARPTKPFMMRWDPERKKYLLVRN